MSSSFSITSPLSASASASTRNPSYSSCSSTKSPAWEKIKSVIAIVALVAFNIFALWGCPVIYGIFLGCGLIAGKWVQNNISNVFSNILRKGGWKWIVPSCIPLYTLLLPATLIMQAVFAGADMGSRISLAARGLLNKSFFNTKQSKPAYHYSAAPAA